MTRRGFLSIAILSWPAEKITRARGGSVSMTNWAVVERERLRKALEDHEVKFGLSDAG